MAHKNLNSLKKAIAKKAKEGMNKKILPYVAEEMQDAVERDVYSKYYPTEYNRRGTDIGGLASKSSVRGTIEDNKNSFSMRVKNIAKAVYSNHYLTPLIVMGQSKAKAENYPLLYDSFLLKSGYVVEPEHYPYSEPRDFISGTKKNLNENRISSLLKEYMMK